MAKLSGMSTVKKVTVALGILSLVAVAVKPIFQALQGAFGKSVDFLGPLEMSKDGTEYLVGILGGSRDGGTLHVPSDIMHDELTWPPDHHEVYVLCHNTYIKQTKLVFSGYLQDPDHDHRG